MEFWILDFPVSAKASVFALRAAPRLVAEAFGNVECVQLPARTGSQSGQLAFSPPTHEPNGDGASALRRAPATAAPPHSPDIRSQASHSASTPPRPPKKS